MDYFADQIKIACKFRNIDFNTFLKELGLDYHYKLIENQFIFDDLLDSEKIEISKRLDTVIPFFRFCCSEELLLSNELTLDKYQKALETNTLDEYFEKIGIKKYMKDKSTSEFHKEVFLLDADTSLTRKELHSAIAFLNSDKSKIINIDNLPANEEIYIQLVETQPLMLKDLKFQTEKICIKAVSKFAHAIEYVKEQTEKIAHTAVVKNGLTLEFVDPKLHTEDIVKSALKQNSHSFKFSKLKTYDLCLMAVKANGMNYEFVPEEFRTHEMKLEALNSNGWSIKFFDKQTEEYALKAVLQNTETVLSVDEEIREKNTIIKLIYKEITKGFDFMHQATC